LRQETGVNALPRFGDPRALAAVLAVPALWVSTVAFPIMGFVYCLAIFALDGIEHVVRRLTDHR